MGKKTHGPYLIQAIEANHHEKVHDICAKQIGNKEKVRELVVSHVRRLASEQSEIPLLLAAQLPDPSILQYFVHKHGVDINFTFKEQLGRRSKVKTALIMGVRRGLYDTVEVMLSSNADPNAQDHKGRTALHHAVRKADFRMAKMLLSRGAQPSLVDKGENTPLHVASIFGHVELCKMLIHYGGDLYKKGQLGAIPIHIAAKEGHVALLRLFCQHDVNPNIKMPCYDGREKAALHVAAEEGHHECVTCLVQELGADPNLGDSEGETPLNCCVLREYDPMGMKSKEDYTEAVKVLLRHGAEVNLQNGRGETALHLAARNEFHKIVELLLQAGMDPLIEDNSGDKAIDLVNEEDAVTLQIIKHAMENRERYLNDVFEMKAKGYSTSLDVLSSAGRSTTTLNVSVSEPLRGRAASTPGLLGIPPHQMTYEGYLQPVRNGEIPVNAQVHNESRSSKSHSSGSPHETASQINAQLDKTPEQTYAKIDQDETFEEPRESTTQQANATPTEKGKKSNFGIPKFLKKKKSQESLLERKASQISSDSSHFDDRSIHDPNLARTQANAGGSPGQKRAILPIEQGTRKLPSPPPSTIRDSMLSTDMSGIWDITPRSSTSTFRPDSDFGVGRKTDELMQKLQQNLAARKMEYSDINTTQYESLPGASSIAQPKGRSTPTPTRPAPSPKVQRAQAPIATQDQQNGLSDSDDTFFDDASFDSVSEATVEMVQQQQEKIKMANQELHNDGGKTAKDDPHMQKWISEQATLVQQRNYKNAGPIAHSTPPGSKITQNTPFSDTDDQFTSVSQQVGKPKPPKKHAKKVDKNANSRPQPPPRPPKERSVSVSSTDSFRRPPPPAPHGDTENQSSSRQSKPSTSSIETDSNVVHLEVDEKEPGQTVIRIMPVNKKRAGSPAMAKHTTTESSTSYATSTPTGMSTFTGTSTATLTEQKDAPRATAGRHGSQGYRAGVLDTDSEVMSEMSFSTTSSFFKPVPKKRANVPKQPQISKRDKKDSPQSTKHLKTIQSQESEEFDSDFSDFSDSEEESPNTAHMTARFFSTSAENQPSQFHVTQDIIEREPPTPPTPTTPTIKMTMQMPEKNVVNVIPVQSKKVLPEPPPKPKPKPKTKPLPEPPPKPAPKTFQKPEPPAKPAKDSPKIAKKPVVPKREERPRVEPETKPEPQRVLPIQLAPASTGIKDDTASMGTTSGGSDIDEPLPQTKPGAAPIPAARAPVAPITPVVAEEPVPEKKPAKATKTKKKKKKVKTSKENTPEKADAPLKFDTSHAGDISVDSAPSILAPEPPAVTQPAPPASQPPPEKPDDTYMQPVPAPVIPIEANPTTTSEPVVLSARQKRKMKRQQSKCNAIDAPETEEMKPVEPAVYTNSPPARHKVQHTTSNKDGVPYAMVERKDKKGGGGKAAPVFVKVDPEVSEDSGGSRSNQAPPLPAPLESPYAEISIVDEIVRPSDPMTDKEQSRSHEALDLDSPKRRVTIGNKEFIPNNIKRAKDHDHRRIVYTCSEQMDFDIIGGNADGVFVHNVRQGSAAENAGLKNGDKILKINGRSTAGKTREDVTAQANSIKRVMDILVRERRDIYETILSHHGVGDAFCVRAHFTYKPQQQGELAVKPGDIFSVKDTLPNNTFGYWRAVKLNPGPKEQPNGYIFNTRRAEQLSLDHRMAQLKAFERQRGGFMKKGFNRSKSLDRLKKGKSQEDLTLDTRNAIAYEKIEQRKAPFPKPVLLLGLFCDHVRDLLAKEAPDLFQIPKEQVEIPQDPQDTKKEPVRLDIIKNICYAQKHCLTILSPAGIEFLQKTDFNPIVIYLAPGSKAIVKIIKNRFTPQFDRKPSFLYDEAVGFEKQQAHLFTATVPYTENDSWFYTLMEMIKMLQEQPQWYIVKDAPEEEEDEEGDEYETPSLPASPVSPNMPQFPAPHPGRLNKSMEAIPDPIENMLSLHAAGKGMEQRARAQSSAGVLGGDTDSIGSGQRVPKSILKNKGYSSNTSDSGSASSVSVPRRNAQPSHTHHPPQQPSQPYQQQGYHQQPQPQGYTNRQPGHQPSPLQRPPTTGSRPPPSAAPQATSATGFHPAFAHIGSMAPNKPHTNTDGKETSL